jgi:curved DNA-binding protein CbpA
MAPGSARPAETYYDILGVGNTATEAELRAAYVRKSRRAHPDMGGSEQQYRLVSEAYEILSNPTQRAQYDSYLSATSRVQSSPPASGASNPRVRSNLPLPLRTVVGDAVASALRQIDEQLTAHLHYGNATDVPIAPHLSLAEEEAALNEIREALRVRTTPELIIKRWHEKGDRPPTALGGAFGWIESRFGRLRFLDGTRYEEFAFAAEAHRSLAIMERRVPVPAGQLGDLLSATVVVVPDGRPAFVYGTRGAQPSPGLRDWLDRPETGPGPSHRQRSPGFRGSG